ncbi:glycoside hydrolase family 127 protein [Mucilaginibacter achroorhodeus]|uniref:Glycoside hydrolase family 127 protein n=1 Tax=Mucilaginibacter achroorhodeus TaxID=2599294 RepID=A0A563U4B7_9SPHI|nr:beta-L-arabinofuranosidase domain-containing protein [Mucilaginibacter achroorhodeus]TWR26188.1 glycoside hydrolase family 127 protein [Mucilaginibacter achroorhodeus]
MQLSSKLLYSIAIAVLVSGKLTGQSLKMQPVSFAKVNITDNFWAPRIKTVSRVTIPVCIEQTEIKTPRIRNFEKVAHKQGEKHEGIYYDDSDVYKALEAIAYSLKNHPDPKLEAKADDWIDKIAAAQQPDGYLNTYYTLRNMDGRWTDMEKHEDYNAGHLIEAAIAYYNTTGKRKLLDVATRVADNIDSTFRQQNRHWVSGHEEIELALVKLYHATGKVKYLDLADWYLQQRGHGYGKGMIWDRKDMGVKYAQDDVPVKDQKQIEGHAVRAMYLYTGAADVGAAKSDPGYMNAMQNVWQDVVYRNMYITGGIGSSGNNEGFTIDYDLPNADAYCETCASVGMILWNERMNLLTGNAKYIDVLERSLYNGALDGLSLSGDHFFYENVLQANGNHSRKEWFGTACCPSNIARLVESLGNYIYAANDNAVWVNLFVGSNTTVPLKNGNVQISQQTEYPWKGLVNISISPDKNKKFPLYVRIPGWATNKPVPGETYKYAKVTNKPVTLKLNGRPIKFTMSNGYAVINNTWKKGDVVSLDLPMQVNQITAIDSIKDARNKVALQRGPLVYCVERSDKINNPADITIPKNAVFTSAYNKDLLGGIVELKTNLPGKGTLTAIPYYSWDNRGKSDMMVWLPVGE